MSRRRQRLAAGAALVLSLLLGPSAARAQGGAKVPPAAKKLPRRPAKFESYRGWVALSIGWRDVVNAKIRRKLLSGLPTVIASRAYLFPQGGQQPVALSVKTCRIVFDLWDEVFRIDLRQGGRRRQTLAVNVEGVMRRCAEARRLPLARVRNLAGGQQYFVGVMVEVNPISKQMLERIKRWVALPKGAGAVGPGDSLFGSFVGLFITHVPAADRTLSFRTQAFTPTELPRVPVR